MKFHMVVTSFIMIAIATVLLDAGVTYKDWQYWAVLILVALYGLVKVIAYKDRAGQ